MIHVSPSYRPDRPRFITGPTRVESYTTDPPTHRNRPRSAGRFGRSMPDGCDQCQKRTPPDYSPRYPVAYRGGGIYSYECHRCGHVWTCGWGPP